MIAGILRKLGLFMGDDIDEANNEDRGFLAHHGLREIFVDPGRAEEKARYLAHSTELVRARNAAHEVWGWKDPLAAFYLPDLNPYLRNPCFILVTRDPGAIAQRERIEEGVTLRRRLLAYLKVTSEAYSIIADFIAQRARPTLLVSYERALRRPISAGDQIARFVGIDPSADYESWLETYILPDRPDASITGELAPFAAVRQFGSTTAVKALMEESLRVRREGLADAPAPGEADLAGVGNKLYRAAATLLNRGEYREAQDRAVAIINLYAMSTPALIDGPIGVLAEELAGGGDEAVYPDLVCGAFYLLGMSNLLLASGQQALIYFTIAERMMKRRLLGKIADSILSEANFWMCVFHKGVAAKAMRRQHIVEEVIQQLSDAAAAEPPAELARLGQSWLAEACKRAAIELGPLVGL